MAVHALGVGSSSSPCLFSLTSCLLPPAVQVFRIGHLGNMDELMMCSAISGAEMAMIDSGINIKPGSGISRAIEFWQQTSKVIPTRQF